MKLLLVFSLFLVAQLWGYSETSIPRPSAILHRDYKTILNIFGQPSRIIQTKDGYETVTEWYLGGRRVIYAVFDPYGICISYTLSGIIPSEVRRTMLEPITFVGVSREFIKKRTLNPFRNSEEFYNKNGYTALSSAGEITVSIDKNTNRLYIAQVKVARNKIK
jgi:hypothetical protein